MKLEPFDNDNITLDLEPFISSALDSINVEVERRVAFKVAKELQKLGWVCIPPEETRYDDDEG